MRPVAATGVVGAGAAGVNGAGPAAASENGTAIPAPTGVEGAGPPAGVKGTELFAGVNGALGRPGVVAGGAHLGVIEVGMPGVIDPPAGTKAGVIPGFLLPKASGVSRPN